MSKVTIICLCHNQNQFVLESLYSVLNQTYKNVELVIVDDGSTDGSKETIKSFLAKNPGNQFIDIPDIVGNCAAFNQGWRSGSGSYIIDLAADDVLLPDRVSLGVEALDRTGAGVHFSDAILMDPTDKELGHHNDRFKKPIPTGDLYIELVSRYLICPPTMMFRREVIETLDGYDESLAFEDFDFWVRSSRQFQYCYTDRALVKKRIVENSLSARQDEFRNDHQKSILKVCFKILEMNKTKEEMRALKRRCWHEIRQCIKKGNLGLIPDYLSIIKQC